MRVCEIDSVKKENSSAKTEIALAYSGARYQYVGVENQQVFCLVYHALLICIELSYHIYIVADLHLCLPPHSSQVSESFNTPFYII